MKTNQKNREQVKSEIRKIVSKIEVRPRNTPEGQAQRQAFKARWGKHSTES